MLDGAERVAVLTGAGVSAESGVPTFRDAQTGLWARYDPETLASPQGFAANPGLVWRWYMHRLALVEAAAPNPGHRALAQLQAQRPDLTLITQNVDDLHERAGSQGVIHLHGSLFRFRCHRCRAPYALRDEDRTAPEPPTCPQCDGRVRPDVVWFGEMLPQRALQAALDAARASHLFLVVGTSGVVYPAAQLPYTAQASGAAIIEVNPAPTPITQIADVHLAGPSGEVLPMLFDAET